MFIEQAELCDAQSIMGLIIACIERMRARGIHQWDEIYPNLSLVQDNIRAHSLFTTRDKGTWRGSVCLNDLQPEEYDSLPWRCTNGRALVVHRLCVDPDWQRRGIGHAFMEFAEDFAREQSVASIRLDAYTGNNGALALYECLGYDRVEQVYFPRRNVPFDCFEKILM
jgi:Acetyltransferases